MRIGIVGFGQLGQYLVNEICNNDQGMELAFVWNRTSDKMKGILEGQHLILENLSDFASRKPDLVVEVSHPSICKKYGTQFLQFCDLFIGSPTCFANEDTKRCLESAVAEYKHAVYVPSGALWGANDIKKMADRGTLKELKITMKKHPSAFRLTGKLQEINEKFSREESTEMAITLYKGPVRELCPLAPNNVNTMAAAAIAGHNLGFNNVIGQLISDSSLRDWHVVEVDVTGPGKDGNNFTVKTIRNNPAAVGVVTGNATYASFYSSLSRAKNQGTGIHLC